MPAATTPALPSLTWKKAPQGDPADPADWRTAAACADLPHHSVFTKNPAKAEAVLRACNQCPIRRECEAVVDPAHTWFDGVSGGRLWRNGKVVSTG
ncbi:WhiB family transcriptional regulator [Streptomyces typhae]|uniref:WhiB family transcriptional regulator n=1 Tax=Streptomyces typhae TaxID=2681492 RepID=UPI0018DF5CE9